MPLAMVCSRADSMVEVLHHIAVETFQRCSWGAPYEISCSLERAQEDGVGKTHVILQEGGPLGFAEAVLDAVHQPPDVLLVLLRQPGGVGSGAQLLVPLALPLVADQVLLHGTRANAVGFRDRSWASEPCQTPGLQASDAPDHSLYHSLCNTGPGCMGCRAHQQGVVVVVVAVPALRLVLAVPLIFAHLSLQVKCSALVCHSTSPLKGDLMP